MSTKRVKKKMIDRGVTTKKLATLTGYSKSHISNVINGRFQSAPARSAIAGILGVPPETLWGPPTRRKHRATLEATKGGDCAGLA